MRIKKHLALEQRLGPPTADILVTLRSAIPRALCTGKPRARWVPTVFESQEVFRSPGNANPQVAANAGPFSGGYDFIRFLGTPLATNRGGPADHSFNLAAHLCCIRDFD